MPLPDNARYWFPKPYADLVARLRVLAGFALVATFLWLADPTALSAKIGLPISFLGLLLRGWAAGHLSKNQELAQSGPYAYTRNPLYLGTLLVAVGFAAASRSAGLTALFAVVFLLVYLPVIELEEQHLRRIFPEYSGYAARVPRLRPTRSRDAWHGGQFRLTLYTKNQEYQALTGFLAGALWVIWKVLL